jgi:Transposase IS66 family
VVPLIDLMSETQLGYDILQMDETTVQVLKEDGRAATAKSYMWVRRGGSRLVRKGGSCTPAVSRTRAESLTKR